MPTQRSASVWSDDSQPSSTTSHEILGTSQYITCTHSKLCCNIRDENHNHNLTLTCPPLGPSTKDYTIPARPKPGRKPATDEPSTRRKAQNRESQRNFRARKAGEIDHLRQQMQDLADHNRQLVGTLEGLGQENQWLRERTRELGDQLDAWKQRVEEGPRIRNLPGFSEIMAGTALLELKRHSALGQGH